MLDRRFVRENAELLRHQFAARNKEIPLDELLALDEQRRALIQETEALKAERNRANSEIPSRRKAGEDVAPLFRELKELSGEIKQRDTRLTELDARVEELLLAFPNAMMAEVPEGAGENENLLLRSWGKPRELDFEPREHWEIGALTGTLDFERGVRMARSRFSLLRGAGALMERALINLFLDIATREHSYEEVMPPLLVNREAMQGTGQIPNLEEDLFACRDDDLYLIPTAEVPLTNILRTETLKESDLPFCFTAYTPCFRREAGSYGKDVKGLIRQHQFDKVELVRIVHPERSTRELEILADHAETVLQRLELPYRVMELCSGDLSFSAARCLDFEVWLPGQGRYREISSCSCFTDFQARRCGIRYKPEGGGRSRLVHTLNGSALAAGRTLVAIYENYQRPDGSVEVPTALRPYMGGLEEIPLA